MMNPIVNRVKRGLDVRGIRQQSARRLSVAILGILLAGLVLIASCEQPDTARKMPVSWPEARMEGDRMVIKTKKRPQRQALPPHDWRNVPKTDSEGSVISWAEILSDEPKRPRAWQCPFCGTVHDYGHGWGPRFERRVINGGVCDVYMGWKKIP